MKFDEEATKHMKFDEEGRLGWDFFCGWFLL